MIRNIILAARPTGVPTSETFRIEEGLLDGSGDPGLPG
jgi:hypothetical protein